MYKWVSIFLILFAGLFISGCNSLKNPIKETSEGYEIMPGTTLTVILETPLGSNTSQRGYTFVTRLKEPLTKRKPVLPKGTEIRGLVKNVTKFEKFGDRAGLLLIFDQVVLDKGVRIPVAASLDTDHGGSVVKIQGKGVKDATMVGGGALVGALVGKSALGEEGGLQKGLILGAGVGTGAVLLSNRKEVKLPEGTELILKLDETLFIPK